MISRIPEDPGYSPEAVVGGAKGFAIAWPIKSLAYARMVHMIFRGPKRWPMSRFRTDSGQLQCQVQLRPGFITRRHAEPASAKSSHDFVWSGGLCRSYSFHLANTGCPPGSQTCKLSPLSPKSRSPLNPRQA